MNLSRIHRLLKLISLLQAGRGYNIEGLRPACGVSRRTIFRDLDLLRQSGVPLYFDDQSQQYRIPSAYLSAPDELHRRKRPWRWSCCVMSWATGCLFLAARTARR